MEVEHMKGGVGETSYAKNSSLQRTSISKVKPILGESVRRAYCTALFPAECFRIADLGCSSGPNTLMYVSEIIEAITDQTCPKSNTKPTGLQVFLNDLHGNDFNTLFRLLPCFFERLEKKYGAGFGPCFVNATPGNFYGRLFPNNFIHFVFSSFSLHWLPQVPKGLVSEGGEALNKGNILISNTSPPEVFEAYLDEFQKGFCLFLESRSQEIVPGGCMLLTFTGRIDEPKNIYEVLGTTLVDMVLEGIVEEEKVDRFNLQYYTPTVEEVKTVIEKEGSFSIHKFDVFEIDCYAGFSELIMGDNDTITINSYDYKYKRGQYVSNFVRAILEPIMVRQFGEKITDDLLQRFAFKAMESMEKEERPFLNLVISLTKNNNKA